MSTVAATVESIVSLYLYGTTTPSADIPSRLRGSSAPAVLNVTVDLPSYMAGPGKYASLYQTQLVKNFFDGTFNLNAYGADAQGRRSVTVDQILGDGLATIEQVRVAISHYTTDTLSADYVERAFIWGSTLFRLAPQATFVDDGANKYIVGGVMVPNNDNFDLGSSSTLATLYNDYRLMEALDPYGIGRMIEFAFSPESKNAWYQTNKDVVHGADGAPGYVAAFLSGAVFYSTLDEHIASKLIQDFELIERVEAAAQYIVDGHNIIYGTNANDYLDPESLRGASADSSLPSIYVAGEGDDTIETSASLADEIVHGGPGADTIRFSNAGVGYGGEGNDTFTGSDKNDRMHGGGGNDVLVSNGGADVLRGEAGDDTVHVTGSGATIILGDGKDVIRAVSTTGDKGTDVLLDATPEDKLYRGGTQLTGGEDTIFTPIFGRIEQYYQSATAQWLVNADDNALYELVTSDFDPALDDAKISFVGGTKLRIMGYEPGDLGLDVDEAQVIMSEDIAVDFPSLRATMFMPSDDPSGIEYMGVGTGWVDYVSIN